MAAEEALIVEAAVRVAADDDDGIDAVAKGLADEESVAADEGDAIDEAVSTAVTCAETLALDDSDPH